MKPKKLRRRTYIRSTDRRRMVEIEPESFVNLKAARALQLVERHKKTLH